MPGLGTIINIVGIFLGGMFGIFFGKLIKPEMQKTLVAGNGVCVLFIGITGVLEKMVIVKKNTITTRGMLMLIICLGLGTLVGEIIDIEGKIEGFGNWLKVKTGNTKDATFVEGFVLASLTVCIGAMAIVGSIEDSLMHNPSILISKTILDFIIIMVMTSSLGKGCMFSFVSVGILQGSVTILAHFAKPIMTKDALRNLSLVGAVLIFCVGLNLLRDKKIRAANMLPALVFAIIWAFTPLPI